MEEHRLIAHLAAADWGGAGRLVLAPMADDSGETVVTRDEWTYEVHPLARGVDVYEQALSWTPFLREEHAQAAGRAMAQMHLAAGGYAAPARKVQQLVSSFTIFAGDASEGGYDSPEEQIREYLDYRPELEQYLSDRKWKDSLSNILMPWYSEFSPWLEYLTPLWTHNDFHASNLMWSEAGEEAFVTGIVDFGLCDLTNRVHDLATAIERNIVEWLRMDEPGADLIHLDHLDALLHGYEDVTALSYEEARALTAMLPLVHCEFALSETDYFLSVLHSPEKAYLAYEGYFLAHAEWFHSAQGERLLGRLREWAEMKVVRS
jgi:Ser/Thr protein kinase RdoA (MazF antagonist)